MQEQHCSSEFFVSDHFGSYLIGYILVCQQKRKDISEEVATSRLMAENAKKDDSKLKELQRVEKKAAERVVDLENKLKNVRTLKL